MVLTAKYKLLYYKLLYYIARFYFEFRFLIVNRIEIHSKTYILLKFINQKIILPILENILAEYQNEECENENVNKIKKIKFKRLTSLSSTIKLKKFSKSINFETKKNFEVSIIISIYKKTYLTLNCLKSISLAKTKVNFKIYLVDDCSNDGSEKILQNIKNINFYRNKKNLGYLLSNNKIAKKINSKYIYFLNNDTEVTDYWLDFLVNEFKKDKTIGAVGSKMCFNTELIQEAGGEITNNLNARNVGKFKKTSLLKYNFSRQTSYCSAASLLTLTKLFRDNNYFDTRFVPGYCEDSDYCLSLISKGYKVLYQPFSTIFHLESQTHTQINDRITKNNLKLVNKWKNKKFLKNYDFRYDLNNLNKPTIIFVELHLVNPKLDAGSVTIFNLLMIFKNLGFKVVLTYIEKYPYDKSFDVLLQNQIEIISFNEFKLRLLNKIYNLIFISRPNTFMFLKKMQILKELKIKNIIYYGHDLHFLRLQREFKINNDKKNLKISENMKKIEYEIFETFKNIIVTSNFEENLIKKFNKKANVLKLPLLLKSKKTTNLFGDRKNICFYGNFMHSPNLDAVIYFGKNVFTRLLDKNKNLEFHIYGSNINNKIKEIIKNIHPKIKFKGFAENLYDILNSYKLNIIPLRFGAGIKGKLGISLQSGLPSLATNIACENMNLKNKKNIIICNNPAEFIDGFNDLYYNKKKWMNIRNAGFKVSQDYEYNTNEEKIFKFLIKLNPNFASQIKKSKQDDFFII